MKLEELTTGSTVFHPIWGKGEVDEIWPPNIVYVVFESDKTCAKSFMDDDSKAKIRNENLTSYLYPHPVTVIATDEVERLNELVKAQEELISSLSIWGYSEKVVSQNAFRNRIKQLQSKTEK